MGNLRKVLVLSMIMMLVLSSFTLAFADDVNDLEDWKNEATDTDALGTLDDSLRNVGLSVDNLVQLGIRILISIVVGLLAFKFLIKKDAKAKQEIKVDVLQILAATIVAYFGIDILIKVVNMFGGALL
ncbi:MAG: hypothetical protein JEZ08_16485 [Clostridiales bacterium]|nr:hypothetical protein [Clostridiales bacterium]